MPREPAGKPAPSPVWWSAEYFFTAISAWLLPGAGHWLLGQRVRGVILGLSILGMFWVGEALAIPPGDGPEGHPARPIAVSRKVHPIFFACQAGNGFSTAVAEVLWGDPLYPDLGSGSPIDLSLPTNLSLAILLTSVSGLLNYLLVLHVLDPRTWAERKRTTGAMSLGEPT